MSLRLFSVVVAMVAAAGCSTMVTHQTATTSLERAQTCCKTVSALTYQSLEDGKGLKIQLDESSEAFNFPTGKSYFAAIRLPEWETGYKIMVQSFALGEVIDKAHIFHPRVDLLDKHYRLIFRSDPRTFILSKAGFLKTASRTWTRT